MNNKTIVLENKKYNMKDVFVLTGSSINTTYDINKKPTDVIDKYYLYRSFNGNVLVFADYDTNKDTDTNQSDSLKSLIDYFLDSDRKDNTFSEFISFHENPSIIYIENSKDKGLRYQLINAVGLYEEIIYSSPQYMISVIAEYCIECFKEEDAESAIDEEYENLTPEHDEETLIGFVDKKTGKITDIFEGIKNC